MLTDNFLTELPASWFHHMPRLQYLRLSRNRLTCLPYSMFSPVTRLHQLDLSFNQVTSLELWLMTKVAHSINYAGNNISRISNDANFDLSKYSSRLTTNIFVGRNNQTKIPLDDSLFEMYNLCDAISRVESPSWTPLHEAIWRIHVRNPDLLAWTCTCDQYHLLRNNMTYPVFVNKSAISCDVVGRSYRDQCEGRSSFDASSVRPRFCKIDLAEAGDVPVLVPPYRCDQVNDRQE